MSDQTEAEVPDEEEIAVTDEADTTDVSEAEAETDADAIDGDDDETDADEEQEPETVEFVFGNETFSVPKDQIPEEVADRLDKFTRGTWADYTRKSQDVAEQRKSVEAAQQAVEMLNNLNGEALETFARGMSLRQEITSLEQEDLNGLWQSDPDRARAISDRLASRQRELQSTIAKVQQQESDLTAAQSQEVGRRMDEGRRAVEKQVANFDADAVVDYVVKTYGLDKSQAQSWPLNPVTAVMAHKAMLYDKMQTAAKPKPKTLKAAPVRPVSKGAGGRNVSKEPSDSDDTATWIRKRNQQLERRQKSG